jgi:hypothetical protein
MEPSRQEISRTIAALLDAAFDDDQERAGSCSPDGMIWRSR